MNIVEHVSLLQVVTSSGYMPRSGIVGSSSITMSNFLRNHQTDFQSGCIQQRKRTSDNFPYEYWCKNNNFGLEVDFIRYSNGYSSLFLRIICLENCFPVLYSEVVFVFDTEVFPVCSKMPDLGLSIQAVILCLFAGELSPLMLRDIKEKWLLLPVIFVVRGGIMFVWLSSFGFVERSLLSCFF